ncbi:MULTISPECIES: carbonic anhydrase [unclassified Sphingomonas]|uniref:carbonic anhydrase n=1 Tax=unclassified Sphingomonas TaxID=196159 RepID=UPI00161F99E8|nr:MULTISPECIES: carbonic anhydrase [unclassified Sphingomonas]MBB3346192.1 carbonic anhydrase [Sphingomonas sp. BK069]MBB3475698.1 carbonic anhydrase [Sphingomonas sp. BK345]
MSKFNDMVEGYYRFRGNEWLEERERWTELASGQSPKVMVIACSDSRVDPATIFGSRPGEVFVVRNVAALVPPFETGGGRHGVSAALEFAVTVLQVEEVLVLGHGACGGVKAALSGDLKQAEPGHGGFVAAWIDLLDDAREKVIHEHGQGPEGQTALEQEGVKVSLANLMTFPFVQERVEAGKLRLHGAVFAIADGKLRVLQEDGHFEPA